MQPYKQSNIPLAKKLRKNMTPWERRLWYCFLKDYPIRFQRQKAIGNYIVDFFCARAMLIVELDGSQHFTDNHEIYDKQRDAELNKLDIFVLRISDLDITRNFAEVCSLIDIEVKKRAK